MPVLALDTALDACSAALLGAEGGVLARATRDIGRGHAEVLLPVIEEVFAAAGLAPHAVSRIAVTVGPGSFTGIRVGLAAARGLGLALAVPVVGVTTLEALAAEALAEAGAPVLAVIDARRGEVYAGLYGPAAPGSAIPRPLRPPAALPVSAAAALAAETGALPAGSGAALIDPARGRTLRWPDIVAVARIGAERPAPARPPGPLYLRAADAKPQEGFRIARAVDAAP